MGETTETKGKTLITARLHFVKRGTQLWGFTEHYGAILGTHEAMIAQMPAIVPSILQGHRALSSISATSAAPSSSLLALIPSTARSLSSAM